MLTLTDANFPLVSQARILAERAVAHSALPEHQAASQQQIELLQQQLLQYHLLAAEQQQQQLTVEQVQHLLMARLQEEQVRYGRYVLMRVCMIIRMEK